MFFSKSISPMLAEILFLVGDVCCTPCAGLACLTRELGATRSLLLALFPPDPFSFSATLELFCETHALLLVGPPCTGPSTEGRFFEFSSLFVSTLWGIGRGCVGLLRPKLEDPPPPIYRHICLLFPSRGEMPSVFLDSRAPGMHFKEVFQKMRLRPVPVLPRKQVSRPLLFHHWVSFNFPESLSCRNFACGLSFARSFRNFCTAVSNSIFRGPF